MTQAPGSARSGGGEEPPNGPVEETSASADSCPPPQGPSLSDFAAVEWQTAVGERHFRRLYEYAAHLGTLATQAQAAGDIRSARVFQGLADVCSLSLRTDRQEEPFKPLAVTPTFATGSIEDLNRETVMAFSSLAAGTMDVRLRARMADVAWVVLRDFEAAKTAVGAYLEMAESIGSADWVGDFKNLERAVQIAAELGRANDQLRRVTDFIQGRLEHARSDRGFFTARLMTLMLDIGIGDASSNAALAAQLGQQAAAAKQFHLSRGYWDLAAQWAARAKDSENHRAYLLEVGESHVAEAEEALAKPGVGRLLASSHLQRAIEALRRVSGSRERVEAIHARLVAIQRDATSELATISHSVDIGAFVDEAEAAVRGQPLANALVILGQRSPIPAVAALRETAERHAKEYLFQSLFPKVMLSNEGKVTARQGSVTSNDPKEREAALQAEMYGLAAQYHEVIPQMSIDPMRRQIVRDHSLSKLDLLPILSNNPLVPLGRRNLFAEGFVAGFYGDFVQATHVLIPQLEHSVRVLLYRMGKRVSSLDGYGIQKELNLNNLLYFPELTSVFGDDIVFALRGLLVERFGSNIRNRMVHGLMDYGEFFTGSVMYLWWLSFRLCVLPGLAQLTKAASVIDPATAGGTDEKQTNEDCA